MKFPVNIVFSTIAHVAIITTAFTLAGRDWTLSVPADTLTVSLVNGSSEIKALDAQDQKKQAIYSPVPPIQDTARRNHQDYGAAVKEEITSETGRAENHIVTPSGEDNTGKRIPTELLVVQLGAPGSAQARGKSLSSQVGQQGVPAGNTASGAPSNDQVMTQAKGVNTEDGKAIRKAIEKALIYPLFARKRRWEGTALTEFTVNLKGYPEDIRIVGSSGYDILDTAAKEALSQAAPFTVGKGRYEIPIRFRLTNN